MSVVIPKIIMQTGRAAKNSILEKLAKSQCPNYEYNYFTDSDILRYFYTNPIEQFPNIVDKFNSFSGGPHKSDLFRYYYLYLNGGVYFDTDLVLQDNIENIIQDYEFIGIESGSIMFNGFIATTPKNLILHQALECAYNTKQNQLIGNYLLFCTQLKTLVTLNISKIKIKCYKEHIDRSNRVANILNDNNKIIMTHYYYKKNTPLQLMPVQDSWEKIFNDE